MGYSDDDTSGSRFPTLMEDAYDVNESCDRCAAEAIEDDPTRGDEPVDEALLWW